MLMIAATLLFLIGLFHSLRGGKYLIKPLLERDDLPVILGSIRNTRLTLWAGWHIVTLFWWAIATSLVWMTLVPEHAVAAFLCMISVACLVAGVAALVLSSGAHLSWVFFLPISVLTGAAALF